MGEREQNVSGNGRCRYLVPRTVSFADNDPWGDNVDVIAEAGYINAITERLPSWLEWPASKWLPIQYALKVLWRSRNYSGIAVGRYGMWVPVVRDVLRLRFRAIMIDTEWRENETGWLNRHAALSADVVGCFTRAEMERYSNKFNVPLEKFVLLLQAFQKRDLRDTRDEGYVFTGGLQGRDWKTLLQAVDGLPYPVRIYTKYKFDKLPSNVTATATDREGYYTAMAAASCVAVPVLPEKLRIPGTTTWIAAMSLGKVAICTEPYGTPDYMENGVSGFYVDYGDAEGLRKYIIQVMEDADLRKRVGENARRRAWAEFSPDAFRRRVLSLLAADRERQA